MVDIVFWFCANQLAVRNLVTRQGDPVPFQNRTTSPATLGTDCPSAVVNGNECSIIWPGAIKSQSRSADLKHLIKPDDDIYVRVLMYGPLDSTFHYVKVPRLGLLGLNWFNTTQSFGPSGKHRLAVRLENGTIPQDSIPKSLRVAFKE